MGWLRSGLSGSTCQGSRWCHKGLVSMMLQIFRPSVILLHSGWGRGSMLALFFLSPKRCPLCLACLERLILYSNCHWYRSDRPSAYRNLEGPWTLPGLMEALSIHCKPLSGLFDGFTSSCVSPFLIGRCREWIPVPTGMG